MKRMLSLCAAALCLTLALTPTALAADFEPAVPNAKVCYPTAIVRSDDGTELKKIYDLSPEDDPAVFLVLILNRTDAAIPSLTC